MGILNTILENVTQKNKLQAAYQGILTKIDGQILCVLDHSFEHLARDQFDAILGLLRD